MARVPATRSPKPRATRTRKPAASKTIATISQEHLVAVQKAHHLVSTKDLELKAANHFLEKINDEIAESYDLPDKFTIDLSNGEITEG